MKAYEIKNLQNELAKHERIAASIKQMIQEHDGPAWSKNNLIKEYNLNVRIIKSIKADLAA